MTKPYEDRRSHRAYRDPTADTAIANVMREERRKKKQQERCGKYPGGAPVRKKPGSGPSRFQGGDRHAWK